MIHSNSLLIESDINTIYKIFSTEKFINKIFIIDSNEKNKVTKEDDNTFIIEKIYSIKDVEKFCTFSDYINENVIPKISNMEFYVKIMKKFIYLNENEIVIKYITSIDKPYYIKNIIANQYTIYYVKISNTEKKGLLSLTYYRKFVEIDDKNELNNDSIVFDNDLLTINEENDKIKLNQTLIISVSALLGKEILDDVIMPFVYTFYDDFINKFVNKRIKKYLTKKKINVYSKIK
jgi:hypothetical protein|uniref:Uncharacterized protein n=1 Tax=viral metagenome TaxID=1070528 RepID=A0A6C0JR76_9ZZZZ